MEPSPFLFFTIVFLLLLFMSSHLLPVTPKPHSNFTDLESLLAFKAQVTDPNGILDTNWSTNTSFCCWIGVSCSHHRLRVTAIDLRGMSLHGTISPHLGNISFLSYLNIGNNTLSGPIPDTLGSLPRLAKLALPYNYLSGPVPFQIFNMSSLIKLSFAYNNLSGPLPANQSLPMTPPLQILYLGNNQLTGNIPLSFAQYLYLKNLDLSHNNFCGDILADLGNLVELTLLYLGVNQLTGKIPPSIGNLTKLEDLGMGQNYLEGVIPEELGNLLNLQSLYLGINHLTGPIPIALLNASMISFLDLSFTNLTGPIPSTLGMSMPTLNIFHVARTQVSGGFDFITSLSNCRNLKFLDISHNELEGVLPDSVGNLSLQLNYFDAAGNHVKGNIPAELGNLSSLIYLALESRELEGAIPSALARLDRLQELYLDGNRLSGAIPFDLGRMTSLSFLNLQDNMLSGSIPDSLGNISGIQHLSLASNKLSSNVPLSLWSLEGLIELDLSENTLDGTLPPEVSNLKIIGWLKLSSNQLTGNIPNALGKLQMLTYLDISNNSLEGEIPQSFGGLLSIKYLNLSKNYLSGAIPKSLANLLYLRNLNLSFNKLEGNIPGGGVFSNLTISSLKGNKMLCGAPHLGFPPCPANVMTSYSRGKQSSLKYLKFILPTIAFTVLLLACIYLMSRFLEKRKLRILGTTNTAFFNDHRMVSYRELVRGTDSFSQANLLGKGSFGSVFKCCLADGLTVAVKVMNLEFEEALKSFETECGALRMIRHRNLIKIISVCSNLDFKALVLEFMPNGSLEQWLYSDSHCINLLQRLNIMIDVSSALEYLHHHHPHVVLHCDLKPGNVLLDEEMVAHVADFGIAKMLIGDSKSIASISTPGTIGYIAPEYGLTGTLSRMGDVYSFGILLLETFTRKRPTDVVFDGESNLREWICKAHPATLLDIVDYNLIKDSSDIEQRSEELGATHQCLSSIIELGLLCSSFSPMERIPMTDVVPRLQKIKLEYTSHARQSSA